MTGAHVRLEPHPQRVGPQRADAPDAEGSQAFGHDIPAPCDITRMWQSDRAVGPELAERDGHGDLEHHGEDQESEGEHSGGYPHFC
jgi:hypothetical protein